MLELRKIEQFMSGDPQAAEEAFSAIEEHVRSFLGRYLVSYLANDEDRKDAIQIILERLWNQRTRLQVRGIGAWWAYLAQMARWHCLDRAKRLEHTGLETEIPIEDLSFIETVAEFGTDRARLYRAADELWLGTEPRTEFAQRKLRLLAAQLHYLHGAEWDEIVQTVSIRRSVSRAELDRWLVDPSVLHELAYVELYFANDELTAYILRPAKPLTEAELDEQSFQANRNSGVAMDGWNWDQVRIVILKYRNGLPESKILQATGFAEEAIETTLEECRRRLPCGQRAKDLVNGLRKGRAPLDPLCSPGTWKRLVFQYSIANELPHKHILELMVPAAECAGYSLTSATLTGWLSNGRLFHQLAAYLSREESHDC